MPNRSGRLATRNPGPAHRSPEQILADLHSLTRNWADDRPVGMCDILLDALADAQPDLKEKR